MAKIPNKWKMSDEDKVIQIAAKVDSRFYTVEVENDDVTTDEAKAVKKLAKDIARLPQLLKMEETIKEMFFEGALDPYPSSDESAEYILRKLTGWEETK